MKTSKRELIEYSKQVNAIDLNKYSFEEIEALRRNEEYLEEVAYSIGRYGVNAYLFQGHKTKQFYVVPSRSTTLFQVM